MQKFDRFSLYGIKIVANSSSISYKMKHSHGLYDIALSQNGTALVEMDLLNDYNVLLSHVLRFTFASDSDKIQSVVVLPLARSRTSNFDLTRGVSGCQQNLEEQISYPSVVSLDVERDNRKRVTNAEEKQYQGDDGIGMSF